MSQFVEMEEFNKLKEALLDTQKLLAQALKRITQLEETLFATNEDGDIIVKEDKPVISPNFTNTNIIQAEPDKDKRETFVPSGKLENAAVELIKYACTRKTIDGYTGITPSVLHQFRENILPDEFRPNTKNVRNWKRELFEVVEKLAPVRKEKKGNNRGVRLLFPRNFNMGMTKCKLGVS